MKYQLIDSSINKQTRKFLLLILFLFMLCYLVAVISSEKSLFGLKVLQSKLIKDQNDFYHVVGLAQNIQNVTLDRLFVDVAVLDRYNVTLGNYSNQVEVHPLNSKDITPFDVLVYDKGNNENIKNYSVGFRYDTVEDIQRNLEIHSINSKLDITGFYFISGKITNNMNAFSNNTTIIAAIFDNENNPIGIWKAQAEPYSIAPSETSSFTIPITDRLQSSKIHNFTLFSNDS